MGALQRLRPPRPTSTTPTPSSSTTPPSCLPPSFPPSHPVHSQALTQIIKRAKLCPPRIRNNDINTAEALLGLLHNLLDAGAGEGVALGEHVALAGEALERLLGARERGRVVDAQDRAAFSEELGDDRALGSVCASSRGWGGTYEAARSAGDERALSLKRGHVDFWQVSEWMCKCKGGCMWGSGLARFLYYIYRLCTYSPWSPETRAPEYLLRLGMTSVFGLPAKSGVWVIHPDVAGGRLDAAPRRDPTTFLAPRSPVAWAAG